VQIVASPDGLNHAPYFVVEPEPATVSCDGPAVVSYTVEAVDPDGDLVTYLWDGPAGATFVNQVFTWDPGCLTDVGAFDVVFTADDGLGGVATQTLSIAVTDASGVLPPRIVTTPVTRAKVGVPYVYAVRTEPATPGVTWSIQSDPAVLQIVPDGSDPALAYVTWPGIPDGPGAVDVTVTADHGAAGVVAQVYDLAVSENVAPELRNAPAAYARVGELYEFTPQVHDPDDPPGGWTFDLELAPACGDCVLPAHDAQGISWTPTAGDVGSHHLELTIMDVSGGTLTLPFTLHVLEAPGPQAIPVSLRLVSPEPLRIGQPAEFEIVMDVPSTAGWTAEFNVTNYQGTTSIPWNAPDATVFYTPTALAQNTFRVKTTAASGKERYAEVVSWVLNPGIGVHPIMTAELEPLGELTGVEDILGIANAPNSPLRGLAFYDVAYRRINGQTERGRESDWTTIHKSVENVPATGVLATLDTRAMENGLYEMRLRVQDAHPSPDMIFDYESFRIAGEQKIGHMAVAFEDLSVPAAGMPIRVVRSYDSRRNEVGDFGKSWRLELASLRLEHTLPPAEEWGAQVDLLGACNISPDSPAHIVSLNWPDGRNESFLLTLDSQSTGLIGGGECMVQVTGMNVTPMSTYGTTLEVLGADWLSGCAYSEPGGWTVYPGYCEGGVPPTGAPWSPDGYVVKTRDGMKYRFGPPEGLVAPLREVEDRLGNRLVITETGIESNDVTVVIERDAQGRIKRIVGPDNKAIVYGYEGDLLRSVTDREGNTTRFEYGYRDRLERIIDPRGVQAALSEYDERGRLVRVVDATGVETTFEHVDDGLNAANDLTDEPIVDGAGGEVETLRAEFVTRKDAAGAVLGQQRFFYDEAGNVLVEATRLGGDTTETTVDPNEWAVTRRWYDGDEPDAIGNSDPDMGNVTKVKDPVGRITRMAYEDPDDPRLMTLEVGPNGSTTSYVYDDFGQVKQMNRNGKAVTYQYEPESGKLQWIRDAGQRETRFYFDERGNLLNTYGPLPDEDDDTSSIYDEFGNLRFFTDASGQTTEYRHDALGRVEWQGRDWTRHEPDGTFEIVKITDGTDYDDEGRVALSTDALGRETGYVYDEIGQQKQIIAYYEDANDITTYEYDARGQVTLVTYPDETTEETKYDSDGRQFGSIDRDGREQYYAYDLAGRLVRTLTATEPDGVFDEDPNAGPMVSTSTKYDAAGRVMTQVDERGVETSFDYVEWPDSGNEYASQQVVTIGTGPDALSTTRLYDRDGQLLTVEDNAGRTTEYFYDDAGMQDWVCYPDKTIVDREYDEAGRLKWESDQNVYTTFFGYDLLGRLTSVVDAETGETTYEYDEAGNLIQITDALQNDPNYAGGNRIVRMGYDELGRLVWRKLPIDSTDPNDVEHVERMKYDERGRLEKMTHFDGSYLRFEYDVSGRLRHKRVFHADGDPNGHVEFTYTDGGLLDTVIYDDPNLPTAHVDYDHDYGGRVKRVTTQGGDALAYGYDLGGNLRYFEVTYAGSGSADWARWYVYDGLNRLESVWAVDPLAAEFDPNAAETDPNTLSGHELITRYHYGASGALAGVAHGNRTGTVYGLDELDRVEEIYHYTDFNGDFEAPSGTLTAWYSYEIGPAGQRDAATERIYDPNGVVQRQRVIDYGYDRLYRLTREKVDEYERDEYGVMELYGSREVRHKHDAVGNRTQMDVTQESGGVQAAYTVTYTYNERNELIDSQRSGNRLTPGTPVAAARAAPPLPNRFAPGLLYAFLAATLLLMLLPLRFGRAASGRRRAWRVVCAAVAWFFVPLFVVDPANFVRLTEEAHAARQVALSAEAAAEECRYSYDLNGNLTLTERRADDTEPWDLVERYVFSPENRLLARDPAPNADGSLSDATVTYGYDADGMRVWRQDGQGAGAVRTHFLLDKQRPHAQVVAELINDGGTWRETLRYTYGHDLLRQTSVTDTDPGPGYVPAFAARWFHTDGQLSTRLLTGPDGGPGSPAAVTDRYDYDAFGALLRSEAPGGAATANRYLYTGEQFDGDVAAATAGSVPGFGPASHAGGAAGLYYLRARYSDPTTGRFVSHDPWGGDYQNPLTLQKYLYCGADPVNCVDPSGMFLIRAVTYIGALLAHTLHSLMYSTKAALDYIALRALVFTITHTRLMYVIGMIVNFLLPQEVHDAMIGTNIPGVSQLGAVGKAGGRFTQLLKTEWVRKLLAGKDNRSIRGWVAQRLGSFFEELIRRQIFANSAELRYGKNGKYQVDVHWIAPTLRQFIVEIKALGSGKNIDMAQLGRHAKLAAERGYELIYMFLLEPPERTKNAILNKGGKIFYLFSGD
jgi:RHS repeat-associated protein